MPVRVIGVAVLGCVLAACGNSVSGQPVAARGPVTTAKPDSGLAKLLPNASAFPSNYPAITLPADAAGQAAHDLDGVLPGSLVEPSACTPPTPGAGPAISVGTDDETRSTLTVELVRTDQPLSTLRDQLQRCGTMQVSHGGTTATVTTELDPPPPLDADDTLALRRTVKSESGAGGTTRRMQSLLGQIGDVRINVTYMTFGDGKADAESLDSLFTTTVSKVRKG
ncbi:DUF5642 family protein [Nocardia sp. 2]|uniref:DUF5642 family protein n=1 Tax=Nocardia acididurans TaxID=2802282 RepID=A0ABS1MHV5_9NOCA|nr:DUF5642 family protein [Nocardia acididurans]MBL1080141.1 DUF5642 family protein [Nocardia acididurans]